jgi:hypothetical protein
MNMDDNDEFDENKRILKIYFYKLLNNKNYNKNLIIAEETKIKEYCKKPTQKTNISFNNLNFIRCVFLTNEQYNINKIHIPKQTLFIEKTINADNNNIIQETINDTIDEVYNKLNENNTGRPIKVPMPIFILLARVLENDYNILKNKYFEFIPNKETIYGNTTIKPNQDGKLAILDYIKSFFSSGLEKQSDKDKYEKSYIHKYNFKGNIKIFIYIPYLTKDYRYITNFKDLLNSTIFFYSLINSDLFLNFQRTSKLDTEYIEKLRKAGVKENIIKKVIKILKDADKNKFTLYDDLINLCFDGGCISSVGEDFERLVPAYTKDEEKNNDNAVKYSPYLPNRCLSKTNGYLCNIRFADDKNKDISELIKKDKLDDLKNDFKKYSEIYYNLSIDKDVEKNKNEIDKYKSPVDLLISKINDFIKDNFKKDKNDDSSYYYSKDYSENIIKELIILNKLYPGIPEMVLSLYIYNENFKQDKLIYFPWGKKLLSNSFVLNIGEEFPVNNILYSFNNNFALTINKNGFIYIYDIKKYKIVYLLNRKIIKRCIGMRMERNNIAVLYIDENKNQKSKNIFENKPSLVNNCKECKEPYSIILDDDNGYIKIYGNSFYEVTNPKFNDLINDEINIINDLNNNNIDFNIDSLNKDDFNIDLEIKKKEDYLYCSSLDNSCLK